ncbi:MAG: histone deacetylase [Candidatus Marinimicrobia bacterium]|nr:histone deacetylase [Candidatus Neomarinimicrobiota bacterium]
MVPLSLYWSPDFAAHEVSPGHPESARRLQAIADRLRATGQWAAYRQVEARPATTEELALVHPRAYIQRVEDSIRAGARTVDSGDTEVSAGSFDAARKVAGAGLQAVDDVLAGKTQCAFILGRPPGHHALPGRAMGFCLFANAALAANYALQTHQLERVAIIDWDVHHGNGTQEIFYESERVHYTSTHEFPLYPGTGRADEVGRGPGRGTTLNFPLAAGHDDGDFVGILEGPVADALAAFAPELLLISAGFDAHEDDPLGHMNITTDGFARMTGVVAQLAGELCFGRIVSFLEGGYNLDGLAGSVAGHLAVLADSGQARSDPGG